MSKDPVSEKKQDCYESADGKAGTCGDSQNMEHLKEDHERLANILETMTDAFISIDRQWRATYVNAAAERILGRKRQDLLGKDFRRSYSDPHAERFHRHYARAMNECVPVNFEEHYAPIDRWIEVRAFPSPEGMSIFFRDITARKLKEEALRESECRYSALFNAKTNSIVHNRIITDAANIPVDILILDVNEAFEQSTGLRKTDVTGKRVTEVFPGIENNPQDLIGKYGRIAEKGGDLTFEIFLEQTGKWYSVYIYSPKKGEVISIFANITKRKATEAALRESQADLNRAQNVAHIGNWRLNVKINQLQWSDETYRIFGIPEGTPLNYETFIAAVHPDDRDHVNRNWEAALNRAPYDIEHRIIVGNRIKWVREKAELEFDADGNLTGGFGIAQDITVLKRSEIQLRRSEARFRTLAENSPDVIARFDRELRHTYINPYGARVYGKTQEEVIGRTNADLGLPEDKVAFWKTHFDEVFASGKQKSIEFDFDSPNFGHRFFLSVFVPEADETGEIGSILAITRDVTELKKTQQRLETSNRELEQFAYVASHDLQEPLRMVASYTELLDRRYGGQLDGRAQGYMNYIVEGSKRMQRLVQDLLTFSRVGRADEGRTRVDTTRVIDVVMRHLGETIRNTGATITRDPLPTVSASETNLVQLFQNLIGNAIKFRKKSVAPRIHIAARRKKHDWEFSVSDNGIGIDPKYFTRLFIIFKRLHSRDEYTGTGIGLAICKKIVEGHGGRIWVSSEPGAGTTFYFTLPREGKEK